MPNFAINPLQPYSEQLRLRINILKNTATSTLDNIDSVKLFELQDEIKKLNEHNHYQFIQISNLDEQLKELDKHSNWQKEVIDNFQIEKEELLKRVEEFRGVEQQLQDMLKNNEPLAFLAFKSHQNAYNIEKIMLDTMKENVAYLHSIIAKQEETIKQSLEKINHLQNEDTWQLLNPIRATSKLKLSIRKTTKNSFRKMKSIQDYINARPKLKNNLLEIVGLKKLYSGKISKK